MFGTDENYDVIVNPDKGDFEIWRNREVVADEDLTNPNMQISLTEAQKIDASYEVGEEVTDEVIFAKFGRRAILNLRQTLASKILELEKDSIYNNCPCSGGTRGQQKQQSENYPLAYFSGFPAALVRDGSA